MVRCEALCKQCFFWNYFNIPDVSLPVNSSTMVADTIAIILGKQFAFERGHTSISRLTLSSTCHSNNHDIEVVSAQLGGAETRAAIVSGRALLPQLILQRLHSVAECPHRKRFGM